MKNKSLPFFVFIVFILFCEKTYCQDTAKSTNSFCVGYTTYYNYKVLHLTPGFSFGFGKHTIYIGPEYTYILKSIKGDPADSYEKNNWGLNLGYKYYFSNITSDLRLFGQFNFSLYQLKYDEYQNGPPYTTEHKELIIENTATLGINYKLLKKVYLFSGVGIGSYNGFFLMFDSFTPSVFAGIEYRL